jgi:hypothetical protein
LLPAKLSPNKILTTAGSNVHNYRFAKSLECCKCNV